MNWSELTVCLVAASAFVLASCYHAPPPKPRVDAAIHAAKQACEIDALAREHEVIVDKLGLESDRSKTIVGDKLLKYRAEIDASYRFVVENCNNYNLCMQANTYHESSCDSSRASWAESHRKFNHIAERLAELERRGHHGPGQPGQKPSKQCDCNSVFATGCCYDGD